MHRVAELLQRWRAGIVTSEVLVARLVAVRAPVTLECSGGRIDHGHPMIAVPVSDVRLVVRIIDEDLRHLMKRPRIIAAGVRVREPELLDELAVLGELQDFVVLPSMVTPWFEIGQSYPLPGPPKWRSRLPA